ncbi:MAG TPA: hypothetical protein VF319_01320 [Caldimonas sp.]
MDTRHWLILALACSLVSAATGLGFRWWYGRKIQALNLRLQKSDKARQFSSQQTMQARRQVEALQKDLAAQQEAMAQAQIAKQRTRHLEEALKAAHDAAPDTDSMPLRPAHGFADTQPMA